jgi:hypothetical protein
MKVHIYCDERYPDYGLSITPSEWDRTIEISDELHAEIMAAEGVYRAAQKKLAELVKQQNGPLG